METLIRWQAPDGTIISPAEFIPLAEDTRLIIPIGKWVLHNSCMQAKKWHDAGHTHLKLAVNLSPLQFMHDELMDTVQDVLEATGFDASSLELEITESVAVYDAEKTIARMQALRNMGVRIALDDFGTGYSSLVYLKKFPINSLKIARPFIQDMVDNPKDKALVEAIVSMAHSLELSVIAEGVETHEQLTSLKTLKCDEIQGYFFSKPLAAETFASLINKKMDSINMR
nr:EAL domain-containing protein [Planococcus glaciei]